MGVDREQLQRHLKDYTDVTGRLTTRFVCPITLRECGEDEVVEGHILNKKLRIASRKTVIQYRRVDNFFGSRVEPAAVQFLNELLNKEGTPLKHERPFEVRFDDGTKARAFPTSGTPSADGTSQFTRFEVPVDHGTLAVLAEIPPDDPRWSRECKVGFMSQYRHFDWVAAMLKAGYLTWFDMLGYRTVFDPFGDAVRRTLAKYFEDNAKSHEVDHYFGEFRNAVKMFCVPKDASQSGAALQALKFDSLNQRIVFFHKSLGGIIFATTCLFAINEVTVSVTLPVGVDRSDAGAVWKLYTRLMGEESEVVQMVHRARYIATCWEVEEEPIRLQYPKKGEGFFTG